MLSAAAHRAWLAVMQLLNVPGGTCGIQLPLRPLIRRNGILVGTFQCLDRGFSPVSFWQQRLVALRMLQ